MCVERQQRQKIVMMKEIEQIAKIMVATSIAQNPERFLKDPSNCDRVVNRLLDEAGISRAALDKYLEEIS